MQLKSILFAFIIGISILITGAAGITADFSGNPLSGSAPLAVKFIDASTGSPTGWAWYFGDETYTNRWTMLTNNPGWSGRSRLSSVALSDGSIVLMGGASGVSQKNDVWRSTDKGATWIQINPNAPWAKRSDFCSVVLPDDSIVIIGGNGAINDVWRSTDKGSTWTQMTKEADWGRQQRYSQDAVALPDGSIVIMGDSGHNDVWRSTDNGATWIQMTAKAEWSMRSGYSTVVLRDGSILILGGSQMNDIWKSTDKGATWTLVTNSAAWSKRSGFESVVMPDGSIVIVGGKFTTDPWDDSLWRSTDDGVTWTQIDVSASWSKRADQSTVVLPDGDIVMMGGIDSHYTPKSDVWRLTTAGSSEQNPSHSYSAAGSRTVALQAYNAAESDTMVKAGYITITGGSAGVKIASGNPVSATTPSSNQGSTAQPTDSFIPLIVIGFLILICLIGGGFYVLKKRTIPPTTIVPPVPVTRVPVQSPTNVFSPGTHHDVFISHSNRDKPIADAICNYLEARQIRCWIAPRDILPGMQYQESIIDAIDSSQIMVLVFSEDANQSPHVLTEVNEAMSNKVIIIPFRVEDVQPSKSMKYLISAPHWLDAMNPPMEQHIKKLEETIRIILEKKKEQGQ